MKNQNTLLLAGQILLALAVLLDIFVKEGKLTSFAGGLLIGLSVVFNVASYRSSRKVKSI